MYVCVYVCSVCVCARERERERERECVCERERERAEDKMQFHENLLRRGAVAFFW
jgi:hypothetical protein